MTRNKLLVALAVLLFGASAGAQETPPTIEEMWKIIQQQQAQIDELKAQLQAAQLLKAVNLLRRAADRQGRVCARDRLGLYLSVHWRWP